MSDEQLYALALSLVPDRDVAGDLFMDAAGEADLRRRAAAWLGSRGLPAPAPDPPLPELTEAERRFAAHLGRRGRRRRQAKRLAAALAVVLVIVLALLALPRVQRATSLPPVAGVTQAPALAADPTYRDQAITSSTARDGLNAVVYRTQATFGSVTIWWAVEGRGAGRLAGAIAPTLAHNGQQIAAMRDERASSRSDRVVGRTKFRLPLGPEASLHFALVRRGETEAEWQIPLQVAPSPDPEATPVMINQRIAMPDGAAAVKLHMLERAPDYTVVYYSPEGETLRMPQARDVEVWAPYSRLRRTHLLEGKRDDTGEPVWTAIFEPVPDWADSVEIRFPTLSRRTWTMVSYKLPAPEIVRDWVRGERSVHAQLEFPPGYIVELPWVRVTDKAGKEYDFEVQVVKKSDGAVVEITRASGLPPDTQLDQLLIDGLGRDFDLPSITVELPASGQ